MLRRELLTSLTHISNEALGILTGGDRAADEDAMQEPLMVKIRTLIEEINEDGILDVQCPEEIAEDLNLPRPA